MKVSIAIPAYTDAKGEGAKNLAVLLYSIKNQDHSDIEIIVSDHSTGVDLIEDLCTRESKHLNIIYNRYDKNKGYWGANVNNAIKLCSGELIKFMQQDDYFSNNSSISHIVGIYLKENFDWAICGGIHTQDYKTFYHRIIPKWTEDLHTGNNKLGGVSSIVTKNTSDKLRFEVKLNWMGDCDYYIRSFKRYGLPTIIEHSGIVYKQWAGQLTNTISDTQKQQEVAYVTNKYSVPYS